MPRRAKTLTRAALIGLACLAAWPACSAGSSSFSFTPCPGDAAFGCSSLSVPLDRTGKLGGAISLAVERKLAGASPSNSAVVALAGGPGQAADPLAGFIAQAIAPALAGRDLIVFDQRGTGASGLLSCPALGGGETDLNSNPYTRCADQLGAARGDYTTAETVEDIEAIRKAGGYEKLVLYGTSYGTKVALEYAERHPTHVESLVLDSTETPSGPEPFHVATYQAIKSVLAELCASHACARIAPAPLSELARLIAHAEVGALPAAVYDSHGVRDTFPIEPRDLFGLLLDGDLNPVLRAALPAAVHAALRGDRAPLARLILLSDTEPRPQPSEIDDTLFIDTSCEETPFPWSRQAPEATRAVEAQAALETLPPSDFYPFGALSGLIDQTIPQCLGWPDASPAPSAGGALPNVPTLILSGGQDLRTPRANALAVARLIPDAQVLAVPFTGHSVVGADASGCAKAALVAFFSTGTVAPCAAAADPFPPTPPFPGKLSAVSPARGTSGKSGRTAAAVLDTIADLRVAVAGLVFDFGGLPKGHRFGGLRGGYMTIEAAGVRLHGLVYVPGVSVSGLLPAAVLERHPTKEAAALAVTGPAAAHGHLRMPLSGLLTGRLAGHAIRTRVPAAHATAAAGAGAGAGAASGPVSAWLTAPLPSSVSPLARVQ